MDIFLHEKDKIRGHEAVAALTGTAGSESPTRRSFSKHSCVFFVHLHVLLCFSILNLLARLLSGSPTSKQAGSGPNVWLFDHGATVSGAGESVDEKMGP